jgi:hypothetical protein
MPVASWVKSSNTAALQTGNVNSRAWYKSIEDPLAKDAAFSREFTECKKLMILACSLVSTGSRPRELNAEKVLQFRHRRLVS